MSLKTSIRHGVRRLTQHPLVWSILCATVLKVTRYVEREHRNHTGMPMDVVVSKALDKQFESMAGKACHACGIVAAPQGE